MPYTLYIKGKNCMHMCTRIKLNGYWDRDFGGMSQIAKDFQKTLKDKKETWNSVFHPLHKEG